MNCDLDKKIWSISYKGNILIGEYEKFAPITIELETFEYHYESLLLDYRKYKEQSTQVMVKWFHSDKWPRMSYKVSQLLTYKEATRILKLNKL